MSLAEVVHRFARILAMYGERAGLWGGEAVPAPDLSTRSRSWIFRTPKVDATAYLAAADRIAEGEMDILALRGVKLGTPPDWNRDPKTGVVAPLVFGKLLDYRDPALVGDIKHLWEINRHMHLVTLAQAYSLAGDTRYLEIIRRHVESWLVACPFGRGPNWSSALEAALRLINWAMTWHLVGGVSSPLFQGPSGARFRERWLESVHQHARFIRGYFSLHSSANNHLIGEATGLFIAALTWPHWPQSRRWGTVARGILEREALMQNAPDGVNREQASWYQHFVLDLLLLGMLAGRVNGQRFSPAFEARVESMCEYLASIMDAGGHVPMFGDADDGMAARLAQDAKFCPYRSLLATAAILFRNGALKRKAGFLDDKTRWLLGHEADFPFQAREGAPTPLPVRQSFPHGGYFVLGCDFESENEIRLIADAGPLGYRSIAAHGHADALAFTLSVGGREFLIDPGTYAYHTQPRWRHYFRSTMAHNTLRVDGQDQSQSGGNFMWLKRANSECGFWRTSGALDVFEGHHDGYLSLPDPVAVRRRIILDKSERRVQIVDMVEMAECHEIDLFFHFSEHCNVKPSADGYLVSHGNRFMRLRLPQVGGAAAEIVCGGMSPIIGWISRRFDEKQPSPTIWWRAKVSGNAILRSEIVC